MIVWHYNILPNLFLHFCQLNITKGQAEGKKEQRNKFYMEQLASSDAANFSFNINGLSPTLVKLVTVRHTEGKIIAISGHL